jgi:dipeptidyl aminopeptidase/acylaminoacyl peptidase
MFNHGFESLPPAAGFHDRRTGRHPTSGIVRGIWGAIACLVLAGTLGAQTPRDMTFVDLLNVPNLTDPQLSPDGRYVIYTVAKADWKENKRISHLWRVNADGSGETQLTSGADGESNARWSPDGKSIAFLAKRGSDEFSQIYVIPNTGGEARPLTHHPSAVSSISWSPDGTSIYFIAPEPKTDEEKERDKAKDDVFAFDENFKQRHLWRVSVADSRTEQLTRGDYSIQSYELSRDGKRIALTRAATPLLESADTSEIWVMTADGGNEVQLTRNAVPERAARISPDGTQVLFLSGTNERFEKYYNGKMFVVPSGGGDARLVAAQLPYAIDGATWGRDGSSIFFLANMGVHNELFELDVKSGKARQLTDGKHTIAGWTFVPTADRQVLTIEDATNNGDVYLIARSAAAASAPTRVTRVFDYLARDFRLPRQEAIQWKGADGVTVEGLLYYPLEYREGQRYPLVVQTHGGPQASDKYGFGNWGDYVQILTAKGYMVLKPNYRGSTGYGDDFLRDMVGHYYKNSHLDVIAGVDHLIAKGLADPDRLVKMGWSGGGHMTNKIITYTTRFKAASAGAGASNWVSMYAQSDTRTNRTPWFGGTPWQKDAPIDVYWENSPLKYASNVKTPTIILVGERDERVPPPQSVEMYRALKSNGVPTHLYMAPREPHGWQELRHELFKMNIELDWFEKYAMNRPYTWEKAPDGQKAAQKITSQR